MKKEIDHFAHKSKSWDMKSRRVQNAKGIAELIVKNITLSPTMEIVDFGAGTGLLGYFVGAHVKKIVAVDNSPSMLEVFKEKCETFPCQTEVLQKDLSYEKIDTLFDGIISSMTLHHIEDQYALFLKFYAMLKEDGFIALADLDCEDGTFHSNNLGVFHHGFDREMLASIAREVGFKEIQFTHANSIRKPHRDFTVFLMTAKK